MTKDEVLKQALEALEGLKSLYGGNGHKLHEINMIHRNHDTAITAIKEYLAQLEQKRPQNCGTGYCSCIECVMEPKQELVEWSDYEPDGVHHNKPAPVQQKPVAWLKVVETPGGWGKFVEAKPNEKGAKPVYTSPPAQRTWVGLTRGVRVEGGTVVLTVKGGNDAARELCGELLNEMGVRNGD